MNYQQQSPSGGQLNNTAPQFGYQPTGQYQEPQPNYNQSDYSQPQYQDTGYPNQRQTTPGFMTLRQSTPISQKPNPVYTAQPAATTLKGMKIHCLLRNQNINAFYFFVFILL